MRTTQASSLQNRPSVGAKSGLSEFANSIREFKKASRDVQNDLQNSIEEDAEAAKRKPELKTPKSDTASSPSEPATKA